MLVGLKGAHGCVKAFSETDFPTTSSHSRFRCSSLTMTTTRSSRLPPPLRNPRSWSSTPPSRFIQKLRTVRRSVPGGVRHRPARVHQQLRRPPAAIADHRRAARRPASAAGGSGGNLCERRTFPATQSSPWVVSWCVTRHCDDPAASTLAAVVNPPLTSGAACDAGTLYAEVQLRLSWSNASRPRLCSLRRWFRPDAARTDQAPRREVRRPWRHHSPRPPRHRLRRPSCRLRQRRPPRRLAQQPLPRRRHLWRPRQRRLANPHRLLRRLANPRRRPLEYPRPPVGYPRRTRVAPWIRAIGVPIGSTTQGIRGRTPKSTRSARKRTSVPLRSSRDLARSSVSRSL